MSIGWVSRKTFCSCWLVFLIQTTPTSLSNTFPKFPINKEMGSQISTKGAPNRNRGVSARWSNLTPPLKWKKRLILITKELHDQKSLNYQHIASFCCFPWLIFRPCSVICSIEKWSSQILSVWGQTCSGGLMDRKKISFCFRFAGKEVTSTILEISPPNLLPTVKSHCKINFFTDFVHWSIHWTSMMCYMMSSLMQHLILHWCSMILLSPN